MNDFVAWQRPAVYALATAAPAGARLTADLPITLHDDAGDLAPAPASFLLAGPGDIANLAAGQVTGRRPHPGCIDAEATMLAHVEIATPDLPWRYSPQPHAAGLVAVRPWLILVVGTPAEVTRLADGRVRLTSQETFEGRTLFDWHPLAQAHRWAHVHTVAGRSPFARVISPRKLDTGQDYVAALVPGWQAVLAPDGTQQPDRLVDGRRGDRHAEVLRQLGFSNHVGGRRLRLDRPPAGAAERRRPAATHREPVRPRPGHRRPCPRYDAGGRRRADRHPAPRRSARRRPAPGGGRHRDRGARRRPRPGRPLGAHAPPVRRPVASRSGRRRGLAVASAGRRRRARRVAARDAGGSEAPRRGRTRRLGGDRLAGTDLRRRRPTGRRGSRCGATNPASHPRACAPPAACGNGGCPPIRWPASPR